MTTWRENLSVNKHVMQYYICCIIYTYINRYTAGTITILYQYTLEFHADAPPPPTQSPSFPFKHLFVYLDEGPVYSKPVSTRGPQR